MFERKTQVDHYRAFSDQRTFSSSGFLSFERIALVQTSHPTILSPKAVRSSHTLPTSRLVNLTILRD